MFGVCASSSKRAVFNDSLLVKKAGLAGGKVSLYGPPK